MSLKNPHLHYSAPALALAALTTMAAPLVYGQPSASPQALEEIVVTARKREESLQEVPIAISALSSEDLRVKGITKPDDLKFHTPGLEIRNQSIQRNSISYFIRGQGQTFGSQAAVATYFADAPLGNSIRISIGNNSPLFDLESVQVLKGPQGTLFGRSTTGGAVLFSPQRPTNEFGGFLEQTLGNYGLRETNGAINIPIIDNVLSARFAGNLVSRDGFTRAINTGQELDDRDRESFRFGLEFTPTDWLSSYLMYAHNKVDENNSSSVLLDFAENSAVAQIYNTTPFQGGGWFAVALPPGLVPGAQGVCYNFNPGNPAGAQSCINQRLGILDDLRNGLLAEKERVQNGGDSAKRRNMAGAELIFKGKSDQLLNITTVDLGELGFLGDVSIKNVFSTIRNLGVRTKYDGGSPIPNGLVHNNFDYQNFQPVGSSAADGSNDWLDDYSEEFQILGTIADKHSWILGYYMEKQQYDLNYPPLFSLFGNVLFPNLAPSVVSGFSTNQTDQQKGYFAQTTLDLSDWLADGLKLTTGYRWTESKADRPSTPYDANAYFFEGILRPGPVENQIPKTNDSAPSWNISLDYQVNNDTLVYLAHRRGFKPGGSNIPPSAASPDFELNYDPETVDDIELGVKADWELAGMPVRTNASLYKMWYTDIQRNETITIGSGSSTSIGTQVANIAEAEIQGLEFSVQLLATDRLQLGLNYSYIDAEYTKWPGTTVNIVTGEVLQLEDSPYVGTPEHQGTVTVRYTLPTPAEWGEMAIMGDYYRQSAVWLNDTALDDNGLGRQGTYGNLNLRFDWSSVFNQPFDISFFVRNVTDDIHMVAAPSYFAYTGTIAAVYSEPRMWGATLRYRFGDQ
ncbi:MAG: hypothetical protein VR73_14680 [Gammaproteobacteria bacterium BRH_c0]|nr:MAG: hypothetical protein VR73_14680 [Gammaproteobacteria bacterium BRH_c0]